MFKESMAINEIISIVLQAVSLGIKLPSVISKYRKHNKRLDLLLNKFADNARKEAGIDSIHDDFTHYFGMPFSEEELNNVLLDLVKKKAKGENIDEKIPHYVCEEDFNKFYDSITQDVGFLKYLRQEIEDYQRERQIEKIKESNELLQKIESLIGVISRQYSNLPSWFHLYDQELKKTVRKKKLLLHDATESLIRQNKVFRSPNVERVKDYLNRNNVCLVKAPEGRGKTFLSRIVAYDFHKDDQQVFFIDFGKIIDKNKEEQKEDQIERIRDVLESWVKNQETNYFLVLENVHACQNLSGLIELIEDWRCDDTEEDKGNVKFLLNTRPTDEGVDDFNEWEEIVELKPGQDDIDKIVQLYADEAKDRQPFDNENEKSREDFIRKVCPCINDRGGTNLRLLSYYLKTWLDDSTIQFVTDVDEDKIIEKLKVFYGVEDIDDDDLFMLLYFSSIFQFDVPLYRDIINRSKVFENDLIPNKNAKRLDMFVKRPYSILLKKQGRYFMSHSFDAYYLCKSICSYRGNIYANITKKFVETFVNAILNSKKPRDFENDFRLLLSGLFARKDEFKEVIYYLTQEDLAKNIITKLNPDFVFTIFHSSNYENTDINGLIDFYTNNNGWLKSAFLELTPGALGYIDNVFFNPYLERSIFALLFDDAIVLERYLNNNYNFNLLRYYKAITAISELGESHKNVLRKCYEDNKDLLKPIILGQNSTQLSFTYSTIRKYLKHNIFKDFFNDPDELEDYLRNNLKVFQQSEIIKAIIELGGEYMEVLQAYYVDNTDKLKLLILGVDSIKLAHVCFVINKHLKHNIFKDFFNDPDELEDYLQNNLKVFQQNEIIKAISELAYEYYVVLKNCYIENKVSLKPLFLELSPTQLTYVYLAFRDCLDIDIVEDLFFEDLEALEKYMNDNRDKVFQRDVVLRAICRLDRGRIDRKYKQVLDRYHAFDYFFYSPKNGTCISHGYIHKYWKTIEDKTEPFDVRWIRNNRFYFDGVSWAYVHKFVSVIQRNMNTENRQQSIDMVVAIIRIVLDEEDKLSYASSTDLAYLYANINVVDEDIFRKLKEEESVKTDIERRLAAPSYTIGDLYLFDQFFSLSWCKDILLQRIKDADYVQKKVIKVWYDGFTKKLIKNKKEIKSGSLLDYIHQNQDLLALN